MKADRSTQVIMGAVAVWLAVVVLFYLVDCTIATYVAKRTDLPWYERGPFAGIGFILTVGVFVYPLIKFFAGHWKRTRRD